MSQSSQMHKMNVHNANSLGILAPIPDVAIADKTYSIAAGAISAIASNAAFSNYATIATNNGAQALGVWTFTSVPGLAINAANGTITGTPTTEGVYNCVVVISNSYYNVRTNKFTITVTA